MTPESKQKVANAESDNPSPQVVNDPTLPRWVRITIAVVGALSSAAVGSYATYDKVNEAHREKQIQQEKEIAEAKAKVEQTRKEAAILLNAVLVPKDDMRIYQELANHAPEIGNHQMEIKEESLHADGSITIEHFYSDGCVQIIRKAPGHKPEMRWLFGPNVRSDPKDVPKPRFEEGSIQQPQSLEVLPPNGARLPKSIEAPLSNLGSHRLNISELSPKPLRVLYQGRCWDPHPGPFSFENEPVDACLIRVHRYFQDGCSHFQYFNACNGNWDVWPNGAAKVTWTRCLH